MVKMIRDEEIKQIIIESIYEAIKEISDEEIEQVLEEDVMFEIDSLVGINLICILEDKLGIPLPDDFLTSDNCRSLNLIVDTYFEILEKEE